MGDSGGWVTLEECLLLLELLVRARPCGVHDVVMAINPPLADAPQGGRWCSRQRELTEVFLRLYRRGLVCEAVAPGEQTADVYELTAAGGQALMNVHLQWGGSQPG